MVDAELLDVPDADFWTPSGLLPGFLRQDGVLLWRYADDGPPADAPSITNPWSGGKHPLGWVVARPTTSAHGFSSHDVTWAEGNSIVHGGTKSAEGVDRTSRHALQSAYQDLPEVEATARRQADALALHTADALDADLFITGRPSLLPTPPTQLDGLTVCGPTEALQLVGLYLRSSGPILIAADSVVTHRFRGTGQFYWVGARNLLPAGNRWYSACVAHDHEHGDDQLIYLGAAAFQRIANALQARDDLLRAASRLQNRDTADETLRSLDTITMSLMASLDVLARVAHQALGLTGSTHNAGWQRTQQWLPKVMKEAPELAALVEPGTRGSDVLTLVGSLRNTIHAEGLNALSLRVPGGLDQTLIGLPKAKRQEILEAADRQGGRANWGLEQIAADALHAYPITLAEQLIVHVISLADALMATTPVERLLRDPSVLDQPLLPSPPRTAEEQLEEHTRLSIRWQIGLEPLGS